MNKSLTSFLDLSVLSRVQSTLLPYLSQQCHYRRGRSIGILLYFSLYPFEVLGKHDPYLLLSDISVIAPQIEMHRLKQRSGRVELKSKILHGELDRTLKIENDKFFD